MQSSPIASSSSSSDPGKLAQLEHGRHQADAGDAIATITTPPPNPVPAGTAGDGSQADPSAADGSQSDPSSSSSDAGELDAGDAGEPSSSSSDAAPRNACGGTATLHSRPGDSCARVIDGGPSVAGRWTCVGADRLGCL